MTGEREGDMSEGNSSWMKEKLEVQVDVTVLWETSNKRC